MIIIGCVNLEKCLRIFPRKKKESYLSLKTWIQLISTKQEKIEDQMQKTLSSLDTNKRPCNIWVDVRTNFFSFMKNFMLEFCAFTIFERPFCIHSANLKAKVFYQKTSDTRFTFKVNNICTNYKLSVASNFESARHVKSESSKLSIFL